MSRFKDKSPIVKYGLPVGLAFTLGACGTSGNPDQQPHSYSDTFLTSEEVKHSVDINPMIEKPYRISCAWVVGRISSCRVNTSNHEYVIDKENGVIRTFTIR